jgi:hypothetical protein
VAINDDLYGTRTTLMGVAGVLLYAVGSVAFGVAIRHERLGPRWVGPAFAVSIILIAVIGLAVGTAQTVGASLLLVTSVVLVRSAIVTGGNLPPNPSGYADSTSAQDSTAPTVGDDAMRSPMAANA